LLDRELPSPKVQYFAFAQFAVASVQAFLSLPDLYNNRVAKPAPYVLHITLAAQGNSATDVSTIADPGVRLRG